MTEAPKTPGAGGLGQKAATVIGAELQNLGAAVGEALVAAMADRIGGVTNRLTEYAVRDGEPGKIAAATGLKKLVAGESPLRAGLSAGGAGLRASLKQVFRFGEVFSRGGGDGKGKDKIKVTNIVEAAEVGVPVQVAYNQWTRFADFPSFMKKVESVEQKSDEKTTWKAQVFWSHRTWESTIIEQVPDQRIVWRSNGAKGHVDGTVTFHELTPDLTRILVVLEYHPQGFVEKTGNIWRAPGRRARLELKHFVRHVMTQTILEQDEVEGWRGEIRDSQVVRDHETALEEERGQRDENQEGEEDWTAEWDEEPEDESEEPPPPPPKRAPAAKSARPARRDTRGEAGR